MKPVILVADLSIHLCSQSPLTPIAYSPFSLILLSSSPPLPQARMIQSDLDIDLQPASFD